jgi:Protein of unknown function (DUF973).
MMSLKLKAKRSKKGLSGAVTALILVIASVIIALVVVGFVFGLFGALGGTPTVTQAGTGTLYYNGKNYVAVITLQSSGNVKVVSAQILGVGTTESVGPNSITGGSLTPGINTVTINFPTTKGFNPQEGSTYQISITLSDSVTVQVAVTYVGQQS